MRRPTRYWRVNPRRPAPEAISRAARILRRGGLVAFPTETVYGLGANALSERAVRAVFAAKGRPADNPLIVHLGYAGQVAELAASVPPEAEMLTRRFWPGPLTLILPSNGRVAPAVTAGLDTVALRMPRHPVTLALLRRARVPVAAPSANLSGRPSPTLGRHVLQDLRGRIDLILEAGPAEVGVESTVLDLTVRPPAVLRPGGVTLEELEAVLGEVRVDPAAGTADRTEAPPRSPGMKYRHYAPRAPMCLVSGEPQAVGQRIAELVERARLEGKRVAVLVSEETAAVCRQGVSPDVLVCLGPRGNPALAAARLYAGLKACDRYAVDHILAEAWPEEGLGLALTNRLRKAAGHQVIEV
ncbi:MAG: L-threonylcarbamoyladenylate synthase [Clostridia bacterium]|jgi:L-threonylcarbamoyladenylate synthase|nr:L-threonylcarbamoyladenylate synthase [Clostridia bacterium]MDH7571996.1 L-threonylcarbamoyladenylate synthase [Clostridia bacterium]